MKSTTVIVGGLAGSGTTTTAKMVASDLNIEHVYAGGIFRRMAAEDGRTLEDFMIQLEQHPDREREVDRQLVERAGREHVLIESRTLGKLLPEDADCVRVWLTCELTERVRRISQREPDSDAMHQVAARDARDVDRYQRLYDININDMAGYDLVVDTTTTPALSVAEQIVEFVRH